MRFSRVYAQNGQPYRLPIVSSPHREKERERTVQVLLTASFSFFFYLRIWKLRLKFITATSVESIKQTVKMTI